MKKAAVLVVIIAVVGAAVYLHGSGSKAVSYRTGEVARGDLVAAIGATGTVEPEELVDVGAQVAGQILSFGKDKDGKTVDYGSQVSEGTVLAEIDQSTYASDVALANAQLEQAKAGVLRAQADLEQMKAKLVQADLDWKRAQKLGPSEALSKSSYDQYQAAYETAKSNVAVDEAAIVQAQATVGQAQASLDKAKRNLGYCTITSPVDGVIIDRRVNIGQTVVSSLNAPSLFLIAKDLKRMQVWVSVNEADVGSIHSGQPVTFTVDAFPSRQFKGEVGKIRLNATMTQNVVTYTVEVITDNSSGTLLPYLTANVQFEVSKHADILQVPNAALRWLPTDVQQVAPDSRAMLADMGGKPRQKDPNSGGQKHEKKNGEHFKSGMVWVQDGDYVKPIKVKVGITDNTNTEVQSDELKEGAEVVLGQQQASAQAPTSNPFAPQFRRR
jgi:HlyD family secretion protein